MRIAVLSGKGGTGKTFVAVNLASVTHNAVYADCDVEEPNGHLFLKPAIAEQLDISVVNPSVDPDRCTACKQCVEFCRFHALAMVKSRLMVFEEVCHSCGGCILFCPENALSPKRRKIGTLDIGSSSGIEVLSGRLNVGEVSGVPIIKELIRRLPKDRTSLIDCPPGSACIVMESIREADYCILVAEPTLYGVHNLAMVHELVKMFSKPHGAVLNKCTDAENPAKQFCIDNQIQILAEIPYSAELGSLTSNGLIAAREQETYHQVFASLLDGIKQEAEI